MAINEQRTEDFQREKTNLMANLFLQQEEQSTNMTFNGPAVLPILSLAIAVKRWRRHIKISTICTAVQTIFQPHPIDSKRPLYDQ